MHYHANTAHRDATPIVGTEGTNMCSFPPFHYIISLSTLQIVYIQLRYIPLTSVYYTLTEVSLRRLLRYLP